MSNERNNLGEDRLVANTYRELARERAPDHLNEKVLGLASGGRSRLSLTRSWTRPVAWAATIGLSLALVLELNRLPQTDPVPASVSGSDRAAASDTVRAEGESAPGTARTPVPASEPPVNRTIEIKRSRPEAPAKERSDSVSMDEFVPQDMTVLRDAEDMARAQAGPNQGPGAPMEKVEDTSTEEALVREVTAVGSFAVVAGENAPKADLACPEKERESAESWFACIETLRENGLFELADAEYQEFQRIFPDFVDSKAHK